MPARRCVAAAVLWCVALWYTDSRTSAQRGTTVPDPSSVRKAEDDREQWQKVPEIFAALRISSGSRVADVGAGSGFFSVRLSRVVGPQGRVYAVDINPNAVRELEERVAREGLMNIDVVTGTDTSPRLPSALDAVLIVNAYHEMDAHQAILDEIRRSLTLEGRLVIVEPIAAAREHTSRDEQRRNHEIAMRYVVEDLQQAGFAVIERRERFVENLLDRDIEWMIVAAPLY